ncbi:hypothetical protein ACEPAH_7228 [Sanghuangporus vaninii]
MSQAGPSRLKPHQSRPTRYSFEVIHIEDVQRESEIGQLYVEVKVNKDIYDPIIIGEDGKPISNVIFPFSQSGSHVVFNIAVKQSEKRSKDRLLGHVRVEEDVHILLQRSHTYRLKRDLTLNRSVPVVGGKRPAAAGTIHLCLKVVDDREWAELCVRLADHRVQDRISAGETATSTESIIGTIINAVDQLVEIVDTVAEVHPLFELSWKVTSALYKLVSYQFESDAKIVNMVGNMKEAFHFSVEARSLVDRTGILKSSIKELLDETAKCSLAVQKYASHSFLGRMARWTDNRKMEEYATRFVELRRKLDEVISVNIAKGVDNIESRQMLQLLQMQLELTNIDISKVSTRSRCLEGTRQDYRDQIMSRLFPDTGTDENIVWLTGAAGAGKSTIAVTISDECDKRGYPAAYLFFERGKDEYISTIRALAYKIAALHPSIRLHVTDAVNENSNINGSPLRAQFEKLLLGPIQATPNGIERPIVIILDALDECGTSKQREDLVRLLTIDFKGLPSDVRVLITSRPESDIMRHLSSKSHIHHVELAHTTQGSRRDVDLYIREKMMSTVEQGPPKGWEWDRICEILSDAADGLFIWASTAVKMVGESNNPRRKLRALLNNVQSVGGGIDSLYSTLLEQSGIPWHESEARGEFTKILGVILFAKEALSGEDIEAFLGLEEDTADTVLSRLRSVLCYETGKAVRLHHASFADYLTSDRSSGKPWNVDESGQKSYIAERCFDVMGEKLYFNICGIESSFLRNDEVLDLQARIQKAIPRHLDYACRFWSVHFCEIPNSKDLLKKLETFASSHLLYWFEVLSLTKHYNRVASQALLNSTVKTASIDAELSSFLWAAYKLSATFALPISQSAPHIYLSALSLHKGESRVADHYSSSHPTVQVHQYGKKPPAQCIKVLNGHTDGVISVVFSPDGKRIASGSADHTILVWDADSGEVISGPFEGHTDYIQSVVFSPDGKRIASGSGDRTIRVWDVSSGVLLLSPLEGHTDAVLSVVFSPDGKRIASGSDDNTVRVWDADSGKAAADLFEGHTSSVYFVIFSPDGKHIISGSVDRTIRVWDAYSGKLIAGPFGGHTGTVDSVNISPDGKHVILGSEGKTICVWDMYSGELLGRPIEGHSEIVCLVVFSPDRNRIASGSEDSTICVWDADSGELVAGPFKGHTDWVQSVAFSPDGKRIASGSDDYTIRIWDAESGKFASDESQERSGPVNSIAFSPDGRCIASGSGNSTIRVWDAESGELVSGLFMGHTVWAHSVAFSPDGKRIVSGHGNSTICVWDAGNGKLISKSLNGHRDRIWSVAFSPNGRLVASGSDNSTICVWDADGGKMVAGPFTGHTGWVNSVSFSPDGRNITSGSDDRTIRVWNVGSGELVSGPFVGHIGRIRSVTYSPDGQCIASGSADRTVRVWNANSGGLLSGPFEGHAGVVYSVSFSPDGRYIASGSDDNSICVWEVDSHQLVLGPLEAHTHWVRSVAFASDGKRLASGSRDGTIRIWEVNISELRPSAYDVEHTNITPRDRSLHMDKGGIKSSWSLSEDGWVLRPGGELLTWIPEDMRDTLWRARNTNVIGAQFSTRLDLASSPLGEDWCEGLHLSDELVSSGR